MHEHVSFHNVHEMAWIAYKLLVFSSINVKFSLIFPDFYTRNLYTITTHGINAIYILIDLWFCGMPVRLLQFYIPLLYGALYALFTYIYYIAEGTDEYGRRAMYTYLDYKRYPGYSSATIVGVGNLDLSLRLVNV